MADAVLAEAVRSPMCRCGDGGLTGVTAMEMVRQTIDALLLRAQIDVTDVDRVLIECSTQLGRDLVDIGSLTWPIGDIPAQVPAITIDRWCGTGQQVVHHAARLVARGSCKVVVVVGVETTASAAADDASGTNDEISIAERRGLTAELLAARWSINRFKLDAYTVRSHQRASAVAAAGEFDREIIPIRVSGDGTESRRMVFRDETIDSALTLERLRTLPPTLANPTITQRHPDITWSITSGNSAPRAIGTSALLVTNQTQAARLGIRSRAHLRAIASAPTNVSLPLAAPLAATERLLMQSRVRLDEIDHVEVDEEFACVPMAWRARFSIGTDLFNPRGGALALGNPRACGGIRQLTTLLSALEATGGRLGLQTMGTDAGGAYATLIDRS